MESEFENYSLFVTVIIPVRKISDYLRREGFPAFEKQVYKNFELLVIVDDVVAGIDQSLPKKYPWLKIFKHIGTPSEKRNFAVSKAKGEILGFIDDDAYPTLDWLKNIVENSKHPPIRRAGEARNSKKVRVFCGPGILPKNATFLEQVFDTVLRSKFGSGNLTYRFQKEHPRLVDDYPLMNFVIRKNVFKKLKGLVDHWPGEDSKLCEELIKKRYEIQYVPDLLVYHHRKNNFTFFLLQHSRYGFKRGLFFAEGDQNSRKIVYALPSLFLLYLFVLPVEFRFIRNPLFLLPLFVYFSFIITFVFNLILKRNGLISSLLAGFTIFLMHLVYGVYFIFCLILGLLKKINK